MINTYFIPLIHGWPFSNNFDFILPDSNIHMGEGLCGGMCWLALEKFYKAEYIDHFVENPIPAEGSQLYNQLRDLQIETCSASTVEKIAKWQACPDLDHPGAPESIGHRTLVEWPKIKAYIDNGKPVTITLIGAANSLNLADVTKAHRVIVCAYNERKLTEEEYVYPREKTNDASYRQNIKAVELFIYDPQYGCSQYVNHYGKLLFYIGCDNSWIGLTWILSGNRHDDFHGFFLDDKQRVYSYNDKSKFRIDKAIQEHISSDYVEYALDISWKCKIIPCYSYQYEGSDATRGRVYPCPTRIGNTSIHAYIARKLVNVYIKFFESDNYIVSVLLDALPRVELDWYVMDTTTGKRRELNDSDLYVIKENPTDAEIQSLNTDPDRWVSIRYSLVPSMGTSEGMNRVTYEYFSQTHLGNIQSPIYGNLMEINLAPPTQASGNITEYQGATYTGQTNLSPFNKQGQKIFDGYSNNPSDYNSNNKVEVNYQVVDHFNYMVQGKKTFFSQSILFIEAFRTHVWPSVDLKKLAGIMYKLKDILGKDIFGLKPPVVDQIFSDPGIKIPIEKIINKLWDTDEIWKCIQTKQSKKIKQEGTMIKHIDKITGHRGIAGNDLQTSIKKKNTEYESIMIEEFAMRAKTSIEKDKKLMNRIKKRVPKYPGKLPHR